MNTIKVIESAAKPGASFNNHDVEHMEKATEICCSFLRLKAEAFVRARADEPILYQYGNDATPLTTVETHHIESSEMCSASHRKGRDLKDFLAERLFIADARGNVVAVFTDPKELSSKDQWPCFSSARSLMPLPRELDHRSIAVHFHCYDGALCEPLIRRHKQLATAMSEKSRDQMPPGKHWLTWLMTWVIGVTCINHSVHNSLSWSVAEYAKDKDCMRSTYICVESLRNGFTTMVTHLGTWIASVIHWEDWTIPDVDAIWRHLAVDVETAAMLTSLQLHFSDGRL